MKADKGPIGNAIKYGYWDDGMVGTGIWPCYRKKGEGRSIGHMLE